MIGLAPTAPKARDRAVATAGVTGMTGRATMIGRATIATTVRAKLATIVPATNVRGMNARAMTAHVTTARETTGPVKTASGTIVPAPNGTGAATVRIAPNVIP